MEVVKEDEQEEVTSVNGRVVSPSGLRRTSIESARSSPRSSFQDTRSTSSTPSPVAERSTETPAEQPNPAPTPYFPPAYRPASVRSYHAGEPASSSSRPVSSAPALELPVLGDKTRAPGYYPAPTTEGAEVALAVASRSDGKSRMTIPTDVEDEADTSAVAHVATDDKRVLERMRMEASAPDAAGDGEGPSAPTVEVDDQGFEMPDGDEIQEQSARASEDVHPDIPAPPRVVPVRSHPREGSEVVDERHILPSAPPQPVLEAPSAPPMLEEVDEGDEDADVPSAPDIEAVSDDEEEADGSVSPSGEPEGPGVENERAIEEVGGIPVVQPVKFLPRYEP
jgi:hypothetical protein